MGPPHEGLQQRSEWPRILHSAVHAHSPNRKEKGRERDDFAEIAHSYTSLFGMSDRVKAAEKKNMRGNAVIQDLKEMRFPVKPPLTGSWLSFFGWKQIKNLISRIPLFR